MNRKESSNETTEEYNIFRDSLLRYAGYANEVGESFRYQFPRLVVPSYCVSFGYCFADAASTGWGTYQRQQQSTTDRSILMHDTAHAVFDTLLWQSLASVIIPGATINLVVKGARLAARRSPIALPVMVAEWLPTAAGLGSIPFIIHPIDDLVDYSLDNSTRKCWTKKIDTESTQTR